MSNENALIPGNARERARYRSRFLLKGTILAFVATSVSLLVAQGSVGGAAWKSSVGLVRGFPVPYLTYDQCDFGICDFQGHISQPPPSFHFFYALGDFAIWLAISISVLLLVSSLRTKVRKSLGILAAVGIASGVGTTLLTLLLRPIALVYPITSLEASLTYVGGFPWEYFMKGIIEFPLGQPSTFQSFSIMNLVADLALWTLVSFAVMGVTTKMFELRKRAKTAKETILQNGMSAIV